MKIKNANAYKNIMKMDKFANFALLAALNVKMGHNVILVTLLETLFKMVKVFVFVRAISFISKIGNVLDVPKVYYIVILAQTRITVYLVQLLITLKLESVYVRMVNLMIQKPVKIVLKLVNYVQVSKPAHNAKESTNTI